LASKIANTGPAHNEKFSSNSGADRRMELIPSFPDGPAEIISKIAPHVSFFGRKEMKG
jgi:hypothetical protein